MRQQGFAYYGLLFSVAVAALVATTGSHLLGNEQRREKEAELLACGDEIRHAIENYHAKNTAGINPFPARLEWLVRDPHQLTIKRYLRRICRDPMQERGPDGLVLPLAWGLIFDASGQIVGVHSESLREPLKRSGFDPVYEAFRQAKSYADWRFIATGAVPAQGNGRNTLGTLNFIPLPGLPAPFAAAPAPAPVPVTAPVAAAAAAAAPVQAAVPEAAPEPVPAVAPDAPAEVAASAKPGPEAAAAPAPAPGPGPGPAADSSGGSVQPFVMRPPGGF